VLAGPKKDQERGSAQFRSNPYTVFYP
jgi:hypothetical protein